MTTKNNNTDGAVLCQGLSDYMANQKEVAERSATRLIQDYQSRLAAGECPKAVEDQISADVDRFIQAVQWSPGSEGEHTFKEIVDLRERDEDYLPRCLAIIREGTEKQKEMLRMCLDERTYVALANAVLDIIAAFPDTATTLARETALLYGNADERLAEAMMAEAKRRKKAV